MWFLTVLCSEQYFVACEPNNRDLGAAKGEWWGFKGRPQGLQSGDEAELDWHTDRGKNQQAVFSASNIHPPYFPF